MKNIYLTLLFGLVLPIYSGAQTIFVNHSASGSNDGSSWTNAFNDLQDAINAASSGDSIFVAKGTYYPNEIAGGTANNRDKTFLLKNGLKLFGGFEGNENSLTERSADSSDLHINFETILSGDFGTVQDSSDNAYHVVTVINCSDQTILDAFTISNGNADDSSKNVINTIGIDRNFGGGLNVFNSDITISNCIITGNLALSGGGGMSNMNGSEPEISNTVFWNNILWGQNPLQFGGGAMHNTGSSPNISNCHFWSNRAYDIQGGGAIRNEANSGGFIKNSFFLNNGMQNGDGGGAIYNLFSDPVIDSVLFDGNQTANQGAGMYNDNSKPIISNSKFLWNYAHSGGAAMENDGNSDLTLLNVDFMYNWSPDNGGAIQNWKSSPNIENCRFISNASSQGDGGAIYNYNDCSPIITNCIFDFNNAAGNGGAIYNRRNCNPILTNLLITRNSVGRFGGGAYTVSSNGSPCSPIATNITVTENQADSGGGGLFDDGMGNPKLRNSIVHGNSSSNGDPDIDAPSSIAATSLFRVIIGNDYYLNGTSLPTPFTNDVFVDPFSPPYKEFHLAVNSPARDVGNSNFFNAGQSPDLSSITTDVRNADRIMGSNIDLGAIEVCSDTNYTVLELNVSPDSVVPVGTSVTFTAVHTGGGINPIYYWFKNWNRIQNTGPTYTAIAGVDFMNNDFFSVVLKSSEACDEPDSVRSKDVRIKFIVGVNENRNNSLFSVYPNPFNDIIKLSGPFETNKNYTVEVTDLLGKEVFSKRINGNSIIELNLSTIIRSGFYVIKVLESDSILFQQKIIKDSNK